MRATGADGKQYEWLENLRYSGSACSSTDTPNAETPGTGTGQVATPLPPGKCPGTINGVDVVVDCDKNSETRETTTTPSTSTTTTSASPNGTTTKTTVECDGDKCTKTTVVTTTVNGSATATTSVTTGNKAGLCKDEPSLSICKDGAFTGNCQQKFTCSGDAVMCAVAKASNEHKCLAEKMSDGTTDEAIAEGRRIFNGTEPTSKDPKTVEGGMRALDLAGTFNGVSNPFGDACPVNQSVALFSFTFVIPLADNCEALRMLGIAFHAITLLGAIVFVIKGIGG
jgi:hypothetical protein